MVEPRPLTRHCPRFAIACACRHKRVLIYCVSVHCGAVARHTCSSTTAACEASSTWTRWLLPAVLTSPAATPWRCGDDDNDLPILTKSLLVDVTDRGRGRAAGGVLRGVVSVVALVGGIAGWTHAAARCLQLRPRGRRREAANSRRKCQCRRRGVCVCRKRCGCDKAEGPFPRPRV